MKIFEGPRRMYLVLGGLVALVAVNSLHSEFCKPSRTRENFSTVYNSALLKYADKNKDGFVTVAERDAFDKDLLKDKNATFVVGDMPRYLDGKPVPKERTIEWIKNYKPSQ